MSEKAWQEMLDEFRALGGTADNICQRDGAYGRGLFAVDPSKPITIHIPDNLLIPVVDVRFENGALRLAPTAGIGARERAFLEAYENGFSWGDGGRAEMERLFEESQALPAELRATLQSEFHCGAWFDDPSETLVQDRFLASRCIGYKGRNVLMPIVELTNHGPGPTIGTKDGVGLTGAFPGEVFARYSEIDPQGMFVTWGFAAEQPQAFSIAIEGRVGDRPMQIGRNLGGLPPTAKFWIPRCTTADGATKLEFLMLGSRHYPRLCRGIYFKVMRESGFSAFEESFETIQHANRMHFLKLAAAVEDIEGPMARTLRRMARYQLQALSFGYGMREV